MQITFKRHVFATLTYRRESTNDATWDSCSKDFNRFTLKIRRLHKANVHYLRTLESHTDGYPHIHCLLQWPSACLRIENSKYFDNALHARWRSSWAHGISDFQVPRSTHQGQISYILKYITKNATTKTIWKKILSAQPAGELTSTSDTTNATVANGKNAVTKPTSFSTTPAPLIHYRSQKLCSWSRGFDWAPFFPEVK